MCPQHAHKMIVLKSQCVELQTTTVNASLARVNGMVFGAQRSAQRTVAKVQKESAPVAASAMFVKQVTTVDSATKNAQRTAQTACLMTI